MGARGSRPAAGVGLGVSNEFTAATVEILVTEGVLLAVRPGEQAP